MKKLKEKSFVSSGASYQKANIYIHITFLVTLYLFILIISLYTIALYI